MGSVVKSVVGGVGSMFGFGSKGGASRSVDGTLYKDPYREANLKKLEDEKARLASQQAFLAAQQPIDLSQSQEIRAKQMGLADTLQNRVSGNVPSVAEQQLQRGYEQALKNNLAQSATLRGNVNAGSAQRALLNANNQNLADTNGQAAILRAQEQQAAEQNLGNLLSNTRGQDYTQSAAQAQLNQQIELANQAARQGQRSLEEQSRQNLLGQQLGIDDRQFQASQRLGGAKLDAANADAERQSKFSSGLFGGIGSAIGSIFSDEKAKKDISPTDKIRAFLDELDAKEYKYKEPSAKGAAPGKRYGIIAQDLEKSDVGKSLVSDTEQGKMVDTDQAVGALLAAVADLNKRLKSKGK
jgi:hypothetical protein